MRSRQCIGAATKNAGRKTRSDEKNRRKTERMVARAQSALTRICELKAGKNVQRLVTEGERGARAERQEGGGGKRETA
ncbi:hypothetical protein NDU88_004683 [Pleurodeles waltl]|uniref:Uncharacterized protein n=1 Tax=Pleurodeles waltl TaxID=8319 RepID=A0AAV7T9U6_PLEWA|nr:hypothetical protein NDU88_004683 [Pleurodeles waltl]